MKQTQSLTLRALGAMAVGWLLVAFPDESTKVLVAIIGFLFLVPGLVSAVSWRRGSTNVLPLFAGIGSALTGLVLVIFASSFVVFLKYVLGAFLALTGAADVAETLRFKKETKIASFFYIMPLIFVVMGLAAMFVTSIEDQTIHFTLGCTLIVYGMMTVIRAIRFRKCYGAKVEITAPAETSETPATEIPATEETPMLEEKSAESEASADDHSAYMPK